jgi:hypothetical protein
MMLGMIAVVKTQEVVKAAVVAGGTTGVLVVSLHGA